MISPPVPLGGSMLGAVAASDADRDIMDTPDISFSAVLAPAVSPRGASRGGV